MNRVVALLCRVAVIATVASGATAGNAAGQSSGVDQARGKPTRVFPQGSWMRLWAIGIDSDLLLRPLLLAVDGGRAVVFDYGDYSVKSIRIGGALEWKMGRSGQGPGEFTNPTSLAVDKLGQTVVLDPEARRLTIISRLGKVVRTIPLAEAYSLVSASYADSTYALVSMRLDTAIVVVDQHGVRRSTGSQRPAALSDVAALARSANGIIATPSGYIVTFRWSSAFLQLDRAGKLVRSCTAVDSLSFPTIRNTTVKISGQPMTITRVNPKGVEAGYAVAAIAQNVAVLGPPRSPGGSRLIDIYEANCGRYRESRAFPFESAVVAAQGDSLVALINEPSPYLAVFRWKPGSPR